MEKDEPAPQVNKTPPPEDERVEVQVLAVHQYTGGTAFVLLLDPEERGLPIWTSTEDAAAIHFALTRRAMSRPITADVLVDIVRQLGARLGYVWIYDEFETAFLARATCERGEEVVTLECRPSDAIAMAVRFKAPVFVSKQLLNRFGSAPFPPAGWLVEPLKESQKRLRISRKIPSWDEVVGVVATQLAVLLGAGWVLWWLSVILRAPLFLFGLLVLRSTSRSIWALVRGETWMIGPNSLEVQKVVFGWRWWRRYLGGTLTLRPEGSTRKPSVSLWVSERGRNRRLADQWSETDVTALARFVAARTGWPLVGG